MSFPNEYIKRIKKSDKTAFRKLFDFFQDDIFRFLLHKIKDPDSAEDLLQDVFIKVWNNRNNLREGEIKYYLYTIAHNLSLNYIRHNNVIKNHEISIQGSDTEIAIPSEQMEANELLNHISFAIDSLSEKTREVFLLSRHQQLSYKQIAKQLNISISTVESHMVKALREIRNKIPKEFLVNNRGKR